MFSKIFSFEISLLLVSKWNLEPRSWPDPYIKTFWRDFRCRVFLLVNFPLASLRVASLPLVSLPISARRPVSPPRPPIRAAVGRSTCHTAAAAQRIRSTFQLVARVRASWRPGDCKRLADREATLAPIRSYKKNLPQQQQLSYSG